MKPTRTRVVQTAALLGALAGVGVPACGGRSTGPLVGGESHFLERCVAFCPGNLECISGVCTQPCIVGDDGACTGLASTAVCTSDSVEPGAVAICDVACADSGDCSALGDEHGCSVGYCRSPLQEAAPGSGGTGGGGAGGDGTGAAGQARAGTGGVSEGTNPPGGSGGVLCETTIVTSPVRNYEYSSDLSVRVTKVMPRAEITFDWSEVTTDFSGRPVDLANVDMVEWSLWEMGQDAFEVGLNDDTLMNPIVIADLRPADGQTSGSVLESNVPAVPVAPDVFSQFFDEVTYPPDTHLYSVMVANGFEYGRGTYMLGNFQLDPESTNTLVKIDSTSTTVTYAASIAARPVTYVPAGKADLVMDWTKMNTTAAGGEFIPSSITRFRIGAYTQTPAELEGANFLRLDEIAVELYEAPVDVGTKIVFDKAKTKDGKAFAGIDDTHTWLVALNCGYCQNPAPWYLTVLKACPASP